MDTLREALSGDRLEVLQDRVLWYTEGDAALAFVHRLGFEPITAMVHRATLAFFAPGMLAAASMQNGIAEPAFPVSLCMLPMFLFATTFFPLSVYPEPVGWVVAALPLYHAIELLRGLSTGNLGAGTVVSTIYLAVLGITATWLANTRLGKLLVG